jgi:hypothetical protein
MIIMIIATRTITVSAAKLHRERDPLHFPLAPD